MCAVQNGNFPSYRTVTFYLYKEHHGLVSVSVQNGVHVLTYV